MTTFSGGIPEYVGKDNCIMLERNEMLVTKLAETIGKLLDTPKEAEALAQNAACWAKQYNLAFYYDRFLQILEERA